MARSFDTLWGASALSVLQTQFGETVTYTQANGTSLGSITAIRFQLVDDPLRQIRGYRVATADVSAPARGDRITDGSDIWLVTLAEDNAGSSVRLQTAKALACTFTDTTQASSNTQTLHCVTVEQVGAVDEFGRKTFTFAADQLTVASEPLNGHTITDPDGNVWVVQDARNTDKGLYDVRADIEKLEA